jgi:hypothetical protein
MTAAVKVVQSHLGLIVTAIVIALRAQFHLSLLITPSRISQIRKMEDRDTRKVDRHVFMIACVALALIATWTAWIMSDYCVLGLGKGCRVAHRG